MTIGNDPIGGDGGGTPDNTTGTYLPIKRSGSFENSPLHQPEGRPYRCSKGGVKFGNGRQIAFRAGFG